MKNYVSVFLRLIITQAIPLATLPYVLIKSGESIFGTYIVALTVSSFGVLLAEFGFSQSAVSMVRSGSPIWSIFSSVNIVKTFASMFYVMICVIVVCFMRGSHLGELSNFLPMMIIVPLAAALQPSWYLIEKENFPLLNLSIVLSRLASALCLILAVNNVDELTMIVSINAAHALPVLCSAIYLRSKVESENRCLNRCGFDVKMHILEIKDAFAVFRRCWPIAISGLSGGIYLTAGALAVGINVGNIEAGMYSMAEKIVRAAASFTTVVTDVIFPATVSGLKNDRTATLSSMAKQARLLGFSVAAFSVGVCLISWFFIMPELNLYWSNVLVVCIIISPLPLVLLLGNLVGVQILVGSGAFMTFARIGVSSAAFSSLLVWYGADQYGMWGAAIGLIVGESFQLVLLYFASAKLSGYHWMIKC